MNQIIPPSQDTAHRDQRNDEIDLVDLMRSIWADRALIALVTAVFVAAALAYVFLTDAVYGSEGMYTPPAQQQLLQIMPQSIKDFVFDKETAFSEFKAQAQSNRTKSQFYREFVWSDEAQNETVNPDYYNAYTNFARRLTVTEPGAKDPDTFVAVSYEGDDPVGVAELVRDYVVYANKVALRQLKEDFEAFKVGALVALNQEIEGLKFESDQRTAQRIEKLQSALSIAQSLGIHENRVGQTATGNVFESENNRAGINLVEPPLYMYGTKELAAQIAALQKSKGQYFDVPKLPELESRVMQLQKVSFYPDKGILYTEQNMPLPEYSPVKPKKALVLALAVVAGLMIGVMISLLRAAFTRNRAMA